jgi:hypothetical protein
MNNSKCRDSSFILVRKIWPMGQKGRHRSKRRQTKTKCLHTEPNQTMTKNATVLKEWQLTQIATDMSIWVCKFVRSMEHHNQWMTSEWLKCRSLAKVQQPTGGKSQGFSRKERQSKVQTEDTQQIRSGPYSQAWNIHQPPQLRGNTVCAICEGPSSLVEVFLVGSSKWMVQQLSFEHE